MSIWENKCDVTNTAAVVTFYKDVMTKPKELGRWLLEEQIFPSLPQFLRELLSYELSIIV